MKIFCLLGIHKPHTHLDYIYGSLAREHKMCQWCGRTLKFEQVSGEKEKDLLRIGDVRDGDVRGCRTI